MNYPWNQISTLYQLEVAVKNKQAVVVPKSSGFSRPRPAAFVINLSGAVLIRLFDLGMYIYKKKEIGNANAIHPNRQ